MQTKNYTTDLLPLIKSLCGTEFATIELPRIKAMINSRSKRAYRMSDFWPRFLKVAEERAVTSGYVPWDETLLDSIDTYIRIHRTAPYEIASSQDLEFYVDNTGAKLLDGGLNSTSTFVTYKKQWTDVYGDGSNGTTVLVPDEWFEYLAHGVYADWLRAEGQMEKAQVADMEAMDKLTDELLRIDEMRSSGLISMRFSSHASMQSR
tara:strand:- start:20 stop:637 length:618 start_codon:yes stop_codon:yes gene_type:complete